MKSCLATPFLLQECTDLSLRNNEHKMAEDLCLSDKLQREVNFHMASLTGTFMTFTDHCSSRYNQG